MRKNKIKKHLIPILIITAVVLITFKNLPQGFFEQDEWHTFARFLQARESGGDFFEQLLINGPFAHFTPLAFLTKYSLFNIFSLNPLGYYYVSIFLHSAVSVLLYCFLFLITGNTKTSLLPSIFFVVNASHLQAITWIGNFEGTEGAALFGLLFLILFYLYLKKKTRKLLVPALFFLFVALLFKEIAFAFFGFAIFLLLEKRRKEEKILPKVLPLLIVLGIYILFKFSYIFFGIKGYSSALSDSVFSFGKVFLYNLISLPLKVIPLTIVPKPLIVGITELIDTGMFGRTTVPGIIWISAQYIIFDLITVSAGIYLFFFLIKNKLQNNKLIKYSLVMIVFGIFPFLILNKALVFLDSRFYYIITIGVSIFLAGLIKKGVLEKQKFALILFPVLILTHMIVARIEINKLIEAGSVRLKIIDQIVQTHPNLSEKTIIYTESNKSYYGLPKEEKILPFQSGFGQVLLVHYSNEEMLSPDFFVDDFLWDIDAQGYKEIGGRGFGYYRDIDLLEESVIGNNIPIDSVTAFSWNGDTNELEEISDTIRQQLKK